MSCKEHQEFSSLPLVEGTRRRVRNSTWSPLCQWSSPDVWAEQPSGAVFMNDLCSWRCSVLNSCMEQKYSGGEVH